MIPIALLLKAGSAAAQLVWHATQGKRVVVELHGKTILDIDRTHGVGDARTEQEKLQERVLQRQADLKRLEGELAAFKRGQAASLKPPSK